MVPSELGDVEASGTTSTLSTEELQGTSTQSRASESMPDGCSIDEAPPRRGEPKIILPLPNETDEMQGCGTVSICSVEAGDGRTRASEPRCGTCPAEEDWNCCRGEVGLNVLQASEVNDVQGCGTVSICCIEESAGWDRASEPARGNWSPEEDWNRRGEFELNVLQASDVNFVEGCGSWSARSTEELREHTGRCQVLKPVFKPMHGCCSIEAG